MTVKAAADSQNNGGAIADPRPTVSFFESLEPSPDQSVHDEEGGKRVNRVLNEVRTVPCAVSVGP